MNPYRLFRPLLFLLDPENAHHLISTLNKTTAAIPHGYGILQSIFRRTYANLQSSIAGIDFPNPLGMAAGFDKNGDLYPLLSCLGFGYIESGTFTALKQDGNPRPRIFRFPEHKALVNRMGFNNLGAEETRAMISTQDRSIPRGINIGKSKAASLDEAIEDYRHSLKILSPYADYLCINVSSPNTPGLRQLQEKDRLLELMKNIQDELQGTKNNSGKRIPLFLKIAPDINDRALDEILDILMDQKAAGIVVCNTTLDRTLVPEAAEISGGLSGEPLRKRSLELIRKTYRRTQGRLSIIGVGGISSGADALDAILAGASLIQIYTGLIYAGPFLPRSILDYLCDFCQREGTTCSSIVGSENTGSEN